MVVYTERDKSYLKVESIYNIINNNVAETSRVEVPMRIAFP